MRARLAGGRAAGVAAVVLGSLVFVGSALAVTITTYTPISGLPLTPADGSLCPGGTIVISGTGFASDGPTSSVSVSFNGTKSPSVVVGSDLTVYAVVPTGATSGPITVSTAAGTATSATSFYVNPCPYAQADSGTTATASTPIINRIKPASGKVGTKVIITGTSFAGASKVTFGGVSAKFTLDSPTQITATVPKNAKSGKVSVSSKAHVGTTAGAGVSLTTFKIIK
jgi:hypothetical protein